MAVSLSVEDFVYPTAVSAFKESLDSVLRERVLQVHSDRRDIIESMGGLIRDLLLANQVAFEPVTKIYEAVKRIIEENSEGKAMLWMKLWTSFRLFRQEYLPEMWQMLSDTFAIEVDPILFQATTEHLLMTLVHQKFGESIERPVTTVRELSTMEECAVMYCGGFVIHKLLKPFREESHASASVFVIVLNSMCDENIYEVESDYFTEHVKKWTINLNRN